MTVWNGLTASRTATGVARQLASGDAAHAWLLAGPAGGGKRALAVAMAAALECAIEPNVGCGECRVCARVARRAHPDVHHVVPEGALIPVDAIRETVIPEAARSPFEGGYKVFIIEEAERMNPAAQNALLKTLEEPRPDTVFILVSDKEDELLETVTSRCRVVRMEPLPEDSVVDALLAEGVSGQAARIAARAAGGDVQRARDAVVDDEAVERRRLWLSIPARLETASDALDAAAEIAAEGKRAVGTREKAHKAEVAELAEAMGEGRGTASARNALLKKHRREARRVEHDVLLEALGSVASFYRDVLAVRSGGDAAVVNLDVASELERWAASPIADAALIAAVARCQEACAAISSTNANPLLAVEAALVTLPGTVAPPRPAVAAG